MLLAAAAALNQTFGYLIPYLSYLTGDAQSLGGNVPRDNVLASTLPDQLVINTIGGFPVFAGALALVLGALMFGGEYGWGTVKTILTQRPGGAPSWVRSWSPSVDAYRELSSNLAHDDA